MGGENGLVSAVPNQKGKERAMALSFEENETFTRVGPGTPGGEMLRLGSDVLWISLQSVVDAFQGRPYPFSSPCP